MINSEHLATASTEHMLIATSVLVVSYIIIFSEKLHRASAALLGAVTMIVVGMWFGFYDQAKALHAIDANTMLLLMGMMLIVAMIRPTGGFEYLAIKIAKKTAKSPKRLLVYLCLAVSIISMFLDNVTTVIIFAPLTVLITRLLFLNPMPFLMAEAMLSNIGGIGTLVGDPPNIMIGSAAHIDFTRFMIHMVPIVVVVWCCVVGLVLFLFRDNLQPNTNTSTKIDLDEHKAIKDPAGLKKILFVLGVVIGLFFIHHHLHLYPSFVSFIGIALAIILIQPNIEKILLEVEWPVLLFFASLFIIVGGVEASGVLSLIGNQLAEFANDPKKLLITAIILMWVAAIVSAIVDNIPFTVTMIPIVLGLETQGINVTPLWWALALGVGMGGNGTHIGATANIICMAEAERCGMPEACISPKIWMKKGLPVMFVSLIVCSIVFAIFFDFFL
jgi:Na+/H+ antiporter NhaD/arsenite permease-like protein